MKRIMLLGVGLMVSVFVTAQAGPITGRASISATIIHPVGTGDTGVGTAEISLAKKISVFDRKDRQLITQVVNPKKIRILNYGNVFDTSIELDAIGPRKDQPLKACRITVHFN